MTAVNIFEKFCGNNVMFRTQDDVLQYMINILEEDYIDIDIDDISKEKLYNYLVEKTDNKPEMVQVGKFIKQLDQTELNRIYYRNNLIEIIRNSKTIQDLMKDMLGNDEFLDPNEPPEEIKENIDKLWEILENWVYYDHQDFYCWDNADVRERKTVLTIDTDSNFLYLQPFVNACFEQFGLEDNDLNRMTTTNICGYLMGKVIANQYWTMTTSLGIPKDKRPIINMKNEFYYKRIMLTKNKKNYGGMVALQEGNLVPVERGLDIKGLPIKKVSVNKDVREHFTDILQNDILLTDNIRLSKIVYKYQQLEDEIRESLAKGETRFLKPDKINMIETYKIPFSIQSVRGTLLWNAIYPDKEISIPTKVNTVKLAIDDIFGDPTIPDFVKEATKKLFEEFPDLESKGTSVLCVPKDLDVLDQWIIDHLDSDTIVNDNMKPGLPILEAIGFRPVTANKTQIASNIIHL